MEWEELKKRIFEKLKDRTKEELINLFKATVEYTIREDFSKVIAKLPYQDEDTIREAIALLIYYRKKGLI